MAVVLASNTALSTAAYTKTANLVSGTYEFVQKGKITLVAKGSAVGTNVTLLVGGIALVNDQPVPYTGTPGTISINDNIIASQVMNGGRVEFYIRNTTVGALTNDYMVLFEPM